MKKLLLALIAIAILSSGYLQAANIRGRILDSNNSAISGAIIRLFGRDSDKIISTIESSKDGEFILTEVPAGAYILKCNYDDYPEYSALIQVEDEDDLILGNVVAFTQHQLNEVVVMGNRDVFTVGKQSIYPSNQQIAMSGSGLDLIKKLPIPFLDINITTRTISSLSPFGGVAVFVNDIPVNADELSNLQPSRISRVDVIRNPGLKYGDNLAIAINIILKKMYDGIALNLNTTNSAKLIGGNNSATISYVHNNSELTLSQDERYQFNSHQSTNIDKHYLMPNDIWHSVNQQSISMRNESYNHSSTLKYNLTLDEKLVFQVKGSFNYYKSPINNWKYLVSETNTDEFIMSEQSKDKSNSAAINLYLKSQINASSSIIVNVVGTSIGTKYEQIKEEHNDQSFFSNTYVHGRKKSFIGEVKYGIDLPWGSLSSGVRSFLGRTKNQYLADSNYDVDMTNVNSTAYVQMDGRVRKFVGDISLSLDNQYYKQGTIKYNHYILNPHMNLYYIVAPTTSLGYSFNLSPRLPSLSSLNDAIIQSDKWERSVGNSGLHPFNHIENTISAAYYKSNLYAMLNCTYASNKGAIMPTITRTVLNDGSVVFDNGVFNQINMSQWVVSAYLRYALPNNKFIITLNSSYNWFNAKATEYTNSKGFVNGNLSIESYVGKFHFSANINTRYNSLFAETTWFNEYSNSITATYNYRSIQIGLMWEQPFQSKGRNSRVETKNNVIYKSQTQNNRDVANNVILTIVWNWNKGLKSKARAAEINNQDSDSGIMK